MNLSEAFKRLDTLNEDIFKASDVDAFERMKDFRDESEDTEDTVDIIDLEADEEEDLKDSYVGKVIIDCQVCHSKIFKDVEDIEVDEENDLVNTTEECPYCHSVDGYKLLGKIADFQPSENEDESEEDEDSMSDKIKDDVEDELDDSGFNFEESLNESGFDSLDSLVDTELGLCKESINESLNEADDGMEIVESAHVLKDILVTIIDKKTGKEKEVLLNKGAMVQCMVPKSKIKSLSKDDDAELDLNSELDDADFKWYYRKQEIVNNGPEDTFDEDAYELNDNAQENESLCESATHVMTVQEAGDIVIRELKSGLDALSGHMENKPVVGKILSNNDKQYKILVVVQIKPNSFEDRAQFKEFKSQFDNVINSVYSEVAVADGVNIKAVGNTSGLQNLEAKQKFGYIITEDAEASKTYKWIGKNANGAVVTKSSLNTKKGFSFTSSNIKSSDCWDTKEECEKELKTNGLDRQYTPTQIEIKDANADAAIKSTDSSITKLKKGISDLKGAISDSKAKKASAGAQTTSNEVQSESLTESIDSVNINATDKNVDVRADDNGAIDIHIENSNGGSDSFEDDIVDAGAPMPDGEYLAPVDDELLGAIKDNGAEPEMGAPAADDMGMSEEPPMDDVVDMGGDVAPEAADMGADALAPEEPSGAEEVDVDLDDFDEESFDDLGESYLREVYENVESFHTTGVQSTNNKLFIEGLIQFTSGKTKATNFIFESKDITPSGRARFVGENCQICRGKKAFTISGSLQNGKFLSESLNYNYRAKNPAGKSSRLYGTVKLSESYKNKKK